MNQRKPLKELNLLDKFLFDEAMDDPENVKTMLDIILSQNTNLKHPPQTEKEQRTSTDNRQIRLDVYAIDEDDVIYEVEAQKRIRIIFRKEAAFIRESSIVNCCRRELLILTY